LGRRFTPLHLRARQARSACCELDGQQIAVGDAGALLGTDHIIAFLLHHFHLLYASLILFSAAELITGLFLMAGFLTRAAALTSIGLSVVLMLMFGWQDATCIDGIESFCALQMSPTQAAFPPGLVSQLFGPTKQSCAQGDISRSHPLF
jgi:uncharacterized membrane protein YphA (DoxX/SURF4 family)